MLNATMSKLGISGRNIGKCGGDARDNRDKGFGLGLESYLGLSLTL